MISKAYHSGSSILSTGSGFIIDSESGYVLTAEV
jgi:S1-C subfamily serine protease